MSSARTLRLLSKLISLLPEEMQELFVKKLIAKWNQTIKISNLFTKE